MKTTLRRVSPRDVVLVMDPFRSPFDERAATHYDRPPRIDFSMTAAHPLPDDPHEATLLLERAAAGDPDASKRLFPLVYERLRAIAGSYFRGRLDQTLQPTALVHEAFLKLFPAEGATPTAANDREHFLALAATVMRQILVDQARRRRATKRGGDRERMELDDAQAVQAADPEGDRLVELSDALERLGRADPRRARVVELRFLAGMSVEETARSLGVSERTVEGDWRAARAWLEATLRRA
ncbi:MAG: ECF-type sigma factor [Phycisphaerales bacterium]